MSAGVLTAPVGSVHIWSSIPPEKSTMIKFGKAMMPTWESLSKATPCGVLVILMVLLCGCGGASNEVRFPAEPIPMPEEEEETESVHVEEES